MHSDDFDLASSVCHVVPRICRNHRRDTSFEDEKDVSILSRRHILTCGGKIVDINMS